jgi:predicted cupin superfamily sugar epimerase
MGAPVCTIPAGTGRRRALGEFALVGCTVGPGFEYEDFRVLADAPERAAEVRMRWPEIAGLI